MTFVQSPNRRAFHRSPISFAPWACAWALGALISLAQAQSSQPSQTTPPTRAKQQPAAAVKGLRDLLGPIFEAVSAGDPIPGTAELDSDAPRVAAAAAPEPHPLNDEVHISDAGRIDLHVRETDLGTVLEMLSYEARANIVATTSVRGQISANLYDVTLVQALDAVLTPNKFAFFVAGSTIYVGTPEEMSALLPPPETRVFSLRFVPPSEAAEGLKAVLSEQSLVVQGGEKSGSGGGGGGAGKDEMTSAGRDYLIVTDRPDRLDAAAKLLAEIDLRPEQVLVEATVLRATLNESNQLGIDFTLLGGVDFQNVGSTSHAAADIDTGFLPPDRLQDTTFNARTDFSQNVVGGGFSFGLIKDQLGIFLRALEEVTDVVVVANPKVVALNKQEAEVIVGRRDGYLTTTVTETAAVQTVEFLETGTQIKFRPVINADGSVRLSVHPKDSNGGLSAGQLPFEETTEAHANILVNDGDTVLIGGLFRERTVSSRSQVPLLGNIPLLGLLASSRSDQTVREEVIILLTVHVLKDTAAEHAANRALLEDVERVRVGARRGLLGTGRERLAQAFYHAALRRLDAGDRAGALLDVRLTLHNQPQHVAALKLRDELLDERQWEEEGGRMRTYALELLDAERGAMPAERPYGRPVPALDPASPADDTPPAELDPAETAP